MAEREYGNKLTIFATNLPPRKLNEHDPLPSLADRYGDLFASRIAVPVGAYVLCADVSAPDARSSSPRRPDRGDDQ